MSSDNQADQERENINTSGDPLAQRAIEKGKENAKKSELEGNEITINLTKVDEDKLKKLMSRLALKPEVIVESAISLVNYYVVKERRNSVDQLEKKFLVNGNTDLGEKPPMKLLLTLETRKKLEELNMDEKVPDCVRIGINLYDDVIQTYDLTQNNNNNNPEDNN